MKAINLVISGFEYLTCLGLPLICFGLPSGLGGFGNLGAPVYIKPEGL